MVLVGHSYGGMPVRAFEGAYPNDVAGMVLIDVSSEPEVPVYERLDAGPWIDGTDRIDIHATVRELHAAGDLGDIPLVVVTAGIIDDEWLATVPKLAARAQARLAGLSSNAYAGRRDRLGALRARGRPGRGARGDRAGGRRRPVGIGAGAVRRRVRARWTPPAWRRAAMPELVPA